MLGAILSIAAAITFALNSALMRRGVLTASPIHAVAISVWLGAILFVVVVAVAGEFAGLREISPRNYGLLAGAGIIHFLGGRYCNYRSIQAAGANLVGPVQGLHLFVSLVLALVLLGEQLSVLKALGIAMLILGPGVALRKRKDRHGNAERAVPSPAGADIAPAKFTPRMAEGMLFAGLTALIWGTTPIMVRASLEGHSYSQLGALISYSAAALVLIPLFATGRRAATLVDIDRGAARWFAYGGVAVFVSQVFRYAALSIAPVIVVEPLLRLYLVFRLVFSYLMNREHEIFDAGVLVGTALSVLGALVIVAPAELAIDFLPISPELARVLLAWRWPS